MTDDLVRRVVQKTTDGCLYLSSVDAPQLVTEALDVMYENTCWGTASASDIRRVYLLKTGLAENSTNMTHYLRDMLIE